MAGSDQEQLLEQLKEIVESLKGVSQYSKDLAAAVSNANRPMQQMSEYSKAIQASMEQMAKSTKDTNESYVAMSNTMAALLSGAKELGAQESASATAVNVQKLATETQRTENARLAGERAAFWIAEREAGILRNANAEKDKIALEQSADLWTQIKKSVSDINTLNKERTNVTSVMMGNTMAQTLTGKENVAGALSNITSSLSALAPTAGGLGGLFGMLMYGQVKEAEFKALGQLAIQQFDQVGGHAGDLGKKMAGMAKYMSIAGMIDAKDFSIVSAAVVSFGLDIKDVSKDIDGFKSTAKGAGTDFLTFSLSMDKAFEMAAGTTAKFGGTLVRDFNMTTNEAATNLRQMATAARDSGQSVVTYMQQVMEASSALRLMNANQGAVSETMLMASKSFQAGGLNKSFAGAYAAQGMSQVTGAMAGGMNEGVRAIIAQKMYGGDALDALAMLNSPVARGGKKLDAHAFIGAAGDIMNSNGPQTVGAQYKFAESVFGVGTAGADLLLKAFKEKQETGTTSNDTLAAINKAFEDEAKKKSSLEIAVDTIKQAIADTMVGLLQMIVNGLKAVYDGIQWGFNALMSTFTTGDTSKEYAELADIYYTRASKGYAASGLGADKMATSINTAYKAAGVAAETMLSTDHTGEGRERQIIEARGQRFKKAKEALSPETQDAVAKEDGVGILKYIPGGRAIQDTGHGLSLLGDAAASISKYVAEQYRLASPAKKQAGD